MSFALCHESSKKNDYLITIHRWIEGEVSMSDFISLRDNDERESENFLLLSYSVWIEK